MVCAAADCEPRTQRQSSRDRPRDHPRDHSRDHPSSPQGSPQLAPGITPASPRDHPRDHPNKPQGSPQGSPQLTPHPDPHWIISLRILQGTMNFLVTLLNWSLALLVYVHNAQLSRAAPTLGEGDHKSTEVVKFMNVYERSVCQVRETLVDIFQEYPDEVEYIFKPSCVPLMRCAGCCNDESLECVPTEWYNITMQIMKIKPLLSQHIMEMSFQQHRHCECRPKKDVRGKQENHCEPCTEKRKHLFVQDPQTCKCSCKHSDSRCKMKQLELNEKTCRCDKPRR